MPGLNSISSLISITERIERNLIDGTYAQKAIQENTDTIVKFNVSQLYDLGINSSGTRIDTYAPYSPYTIFLKTKKGQPTDRVTLRDTGEFQESFEVVIGPADFYITATDRKTAELVRKYGEKIFGLTDENIGLLAQQYVKPSIIQQIRKEIFI